MAIAADEPIAGPTQQAAHALIFVVMVYMRADWQWLDAHVTQTALPLPHELELPLINPISREIAGATLGGIVGATFHGDD
jgi:hypothetical protein